MKSFDAILPVKEEEDDRTRSDEQAGLSMITIDFFLPKRSFAESAVYGDPL
jgi:hypothetical protein